MRVDQISQQGVSRWLTGLPLGASAKRQALAKLRAILDDAVDLGYIARNPARGRAVRAPKVPQSDVCPFESWEEVEKVAGHVGRYGPIILWACATGMRPEEWAALRWCDIDLRAETCRVSQVIVEGTIKRTGKTEGALRTIALPDPALDILATMPRPLDRSELVFKAPKGGPISLRNFRGRVWISRQLGHADIGTTLKHYARFLPGVQERNLRVLNAYLRAERVSDPVKATRPDDCRDHRLRSTKRFTAIGTARFELATPCSQRTFGPRRRS
jgi:integrase